MRQVASQLNAEKDVLQTSLNDRTKNLEVLKRDIAKRTQTSDEKEVRQLRLKLPQHTGSCCDPLLFQAACYLTSQNIAKLLLAISPTAFW